MMVARNGVGISFRSWESAIPHVQVGDALWGELPGGYTVEAEAVPLEFRQWGVWSLGSWSCGPARLGRDFQLTGGRSVRAG